jgi:hypothetical protein
MEGMTVEEAIRVLAEARGRLGPDAPLVTTGGAAVRLEVSLRDGCVYAAATGPDEDGRASAGSP